MVKKVYSFREENADGSIRRKASKPTLRELSEDLNISVSTLYRIKTNQTHDKEKGRYVNCFVEVANID